MNKSSAVLAVLLIVAVGLAILWKRNQMSPDSQSAKLAKIQEQMELNRRNQKNRLEARMSSTSALNDTKKASKKESNAGKLEPLGAGVPQQVLTDPFERIQSESNAHLGNFVSTAKLNVPPIPGVQFVPYDYDEGVLSIRGIDSLRKIELALFARQGSFTEEQFREYLKNFPDGIPGLEGMLTVQLGDAINLELNSDSGLSGAKYWVVQNAGQTVYLAMLPRADGQGVYFASLKGSAELEAAEELYYQTLQQLKALN